jgi:hypothetical protein
MGKGINLIIDVTGKIIINGVMNILSDQTTINKRRLKMRIIISIVMLVMLKVILLAEDLSYLNKELILSELNTVVSHSFFHRG